MKSRLLRRTNLRYSGTHPYRQLTKLWSLRFLLELGGWRRLDSGYKTETTIDPDLLYTLGLDRFIDDEIHPRDFKTLITKELEKLDGCNIGPSGALKKNLETLGSIAGLAKEEQMLLAFATLVKIDGGLAIAAESAGRVTNEKIFGILSVVLDINLRVIRRCVGPKGLLKRSGLLSFHHDDIDELPVQLIPLDGLTNILIQKQSDVYQMMHGYVFRTTRSSLKACDFAHIRESHELIKELLHAALQKKLKGTNILIYGPPGTGKTELAKLLAQEVQSDLFEVSTENADGIGMKGKDRFSAYQLGQHFLHKHHRALILFDEIEDVFSDYHSMFSSRSEDMGKAWVNRSLNENQVPAIWITNRIQNLDPAYLRRFDYILKLDTPPRSARVRILKKSLRKLNVSHKWIDQVAENRSLSPAIVTRAAKVVAMTCQGHDAETQLENVLSGTLAAMNHGTKLYRRKTPLFSYDVNLLNPDIDIASIVEALAKLHSGRLCLYGPPGTGKSEFAKHVARTLDHALISKRASDLISPYIGETEQNLARMFEEATQEGAILLLDEADSFLQERQQAFRSWEISQVNELLTQMEDFDGIFICATNLVDTMDTASLRRFDYKIKLDHMTPDQVWLLFSRILKDNNYSKKEIPTLETQIRKLHNLTTGDFATVVRQHRHHPEGPSPEDLYKGLLFEAEFKTKETARGIGFLADL